MRTSFAPGLRVEPVSTRADKRDFIAVPFRLYKQDKNWVPPLWQDMWRTLDPRHNALLRLGPYQYFVARRGRDLVGRIGVGIDSRLNAAKQRSEGYLTLFESAPDYRIAEALLQAGVSWLRRQGMNRVTGPQSPSNGDDYRGLLVSGFDSPPVLMDSYNPPYYVDFFERFGFRKQFDRLAFYYDLTAPFPEKFVNAVEYAKKRYHFHTRPANIKDLKSELRRVKQIIDRAMPEWPDMIPPSWEEIDAEAESLLPVIVPDLVPIAETDAGEPIGFAIALPDYNQVLAHMGGKLFPVGFLKYLWYRRKITGGRLFVMFVVPEYQRKGVSAAIYLHALEAAKRRGYTYGEGSTIHEFNAAMRRDAEGAGGKIYKIYRIYELGL
ncbi:MAG: GNAT family N-acetyltransferase [Firmicutes bacterium]|nr:GNAT family N-acetyltransferase [Bacillota bacterium]